MIPEEIAWQQYTSQLQEKSEAGMAGIAWELAGWLARLGGWLGLGRSVRGAQDGMNQGVEALERRFAGRFRHRELLHEGSLPPLIRAWVMMPLAQKTGPEVALP